MASPSQPEAAPPASPRDPWATASRLGRLTLKELREILRDRRTIVTLVLMPLLVYPLLNIGFRQFFLSTIQAEEEHVIRVGFVTSEQAAWFSQYLSLADQNEAAAEGDAKEQKPPEVQVVVTDELQNAVHSYAVDLGIRLEGFDRLRSPRNGLALECEMLVVEGYDFGEKALQYFSDQLAKANAAYLERRLAEMGIRQRAIPVQPHRRALEDPERKPVVSIVTVLPLILILMTITGAVYPAIDLTAGERERGTLEILVAAPVPRLGLLLAKYVSVVTVAMLTATVNLLTMTVTIVAGGLGPVLLGKSGWTPLIVLEIFGLLMLFAAFFSAVLLSLTSFARSFKEAQAYLIPLMLLSLAPGLLSLSPELKLSGAMAVVPLINIVLLGRDLLDRAVDPAIAVVVVLTTFLYAMAAVALAARLFGSEDVLFGSQSAWSDLLRRPRHQRAAPTVASAMFCLAMLFPAYFLVTSGMAQLEDDTFRLQLVYAALGTPLLFAGLPLLTAWLNRDRWRASFNLHPAGPALIGGLLLGISLWPFAHELLLWQRDWNLVSFTGERLSQAKKFLEALQNLPAWAPVLVLGVLPGVCEELCFRGYVFRAMRSRLKPWGAIVASALLFGAFHVVGTGLLTVERFLPSTLLGLVLGWVCYRSGSVFPGMVLHVCHNSLVLLLAYYHPWLEQQGIQVQENLHLPPRWLAMAAGAALCGGLLVRLDRSRVE